MLVRWVASSQRLPLEHPHKKIGASKFLSPYIFAVGVQLYLFISSRLALNSLKTSRPFPSASLDQHMRTRSFLRPPVFPSHFNYNKSLGLTVLRESTFFIHLFIIFSIPIFYEPLNYVTYLCECVYVCVCVCVCMCVCVCVCVCMCVCVCVCVIFYEKCPIKWKKYEIKIKIYLILRFPY